MSLPDLSPGERARYEWQMWCPDIGEAGQRRLKAATVLVSRCGGVGGNVAYQLAAAGVGRLLIAHAGNIKPSDLNRQLLMTTGALGTPRLDSVVRRLRELNPNVEVEPVGENLNPDNVGALVARADIAAGCAPLFEERFALNDACARAGIPLVDAAMYDFEVQVAAYDARTGPCLRCVYPEAPPWWKRQFPVLGAVAGVAGTLAAVEIIKILIGLAPPDKLLTADLKAMEFRAVSIRRDPECPLHGDPSAAAG